MQPQTYRFAVVTGASRGIGAAICSELAGQGWDVLGVSRRGSGPACRNFACDLASAAGRQALAAKLQADGVPVGLLVNNAAVQSPLDFAAGPHGLAEQAGAELAVNLAAPVALTAALVPLMRQPGGVIMNISSLVALHPKPSAPVYSASKAGLSSFTAAMRHQLAPLGIRVVEVMPPLVATDMTRGRSSGAISPRAMAAAVAQGLAGGADVIAPGKSALVRLLNRLAPGYVAGKLSRM